MIKSKFSLIFLGVIATLFSSLVGCSRALEKSPSLADWDLQNSGSKQSPAFVQPKTQAEIESAYQEYLISAGKQEKGRRPAMERLARLEMDKLRSVESQNIGEKRDQSLDDAERKSLYRTVELLRTTLAEFPRAKDADITLYQLAQSYEKLGMMDDSLNALEELSARFPQSAYFAEVQFRIAEYAFLEEDYLTAEVSYSDVLFAGESHHLYEKALVKRGWSRLKQTLYAEATEDFALAIKHRQFPHYQQLSFDERNDFDEYFRALTLAVRSSGDFTSLGRYFSDESDAAYIFHVYERAMGFELRDKNFTTAETLMEDYIAHHPDTAQVADARLLQLTALRLSMSSGRYAQALEVFYIDYEPNSAFWRTSTKTATSYHQIIDALRFHILILADAEQHNYQQNKSSQSLTQAQLWYERYLKHFKNYARQDKVYIAYGELRAAQQDYIQALGLFEQAAYDGEIVLDKEAAYATIDLANKLVVQSHASEPWLDKLLDYTNRSVQLYGTEKRYQDLSLHVLGLAYNHQRFDALLKLSESLPNNLPQIISNQMNYLKALAYIKQGKPEEAEPLLMPLINLPQSPERQRYRDALALSIYNQGKGLQEQGDINGAMTQWVRIAKVLPDASIAADGLYETIGLAIHEEFWEQAATAIELFQKTFPKHVLYKDVTRQLSMVYLRLGANDRAAAVFESISAQDSDKTVKMAALWQAAELYATQRKTTDAIRAYSSYAKNYPSPYPQYIEAMNKLVILHEQRRNIKEANIWRHKILSTDRKTQAALKNNRTLTLAAQAALSLAEQQQLLFNNIRLVEPLADNLRLKKTHMQNAITFYGQAAAFQLRDATLQSTYSIGNIYQTFSQALLESQRPVNLSTDELEQYNMLLEDQAFPFEEKAIEFYEVNMARTADGAEGRWIVQSMIELQQLFPSRYGRQVKLTVYKPRKGHQ